MNTSFFSLRQLLTQISMLLKQIHKDSSPSDTEMASNNDNDEKDDESSMITIKKGKESVCCVSQI